MKEKILIDALEEIKEFSEDDTDISFAVAKICSIATKALSDYASQKGRFVNVYIDCDNGRFLGDTDYSSWQEAFENRDKLTSYIETVDLSPASAPKEGLRLVKPPEMPTESGLYICRCEKKDNGVRTETVTYGNYTKGFTFITVDTEKFGTVIEWLDESSAPESGGEQELSGRQALTLAHNLCVRVSDNYNNDDEIEKADAAEKCAKEIRKYISPIATPPTKESGGDEGKVRKWIVDKIDNHGSLLKEVPNKSNSDVTPVASHSYTSSNSIEQEEIKRLLAGLQSIRSKHGIFMEAMMHEQREVIWDIEAFLKSLLLNSEQEDKRSVASKADSSNDAGNQNKVL